MYKVKNDLAPPYIVEWTYLLLPILSIILEDMISSYLDFGLLLMANVAWPT